MAKPIIKEGDPIILPAPHENTEAFYKDYRYDQDGMPTIYFRDKNGGSSALNNVTIDQIQVPENPSIPINFNVGDYAWFLGSGEPRSKGIANSPAIVKGKILGVRAEYEDGNFVVDYDFGARFQWMPQWRVHKSLEDLIEKSTRIVDGSSR